MEPLRRICIESIRFAIDGIAFDAHEWNNYITYSLKSGNGMGDWHHLLERAKLCGEERPDKNGTIHTICTSIPCWSHASQKGCEIDFTACFIILSIISRHKVQLYK